MDNYASSCLSLQFSSSSTAQEKQQQHPESHPSLHVIRKPPAKPWRKPVLPPAPKVYRVDPHGFRRLVQRLTGMSAQKSDRLQPPAPVQVGPQPVQQLQMNNSKVVENGQQEPLPVAAGMKGLLSPSFYSSWCSFPLLSPGSMASLEF